LHNQSSASSSIASPHPLREGYLAGRPFESEGLFGRLAPFMLVALAGIVAVAIVGDVGSERSCCWPR